MAESRSGRDRAAALLTGPLGAVAGGHASVPLDEYLVVPDRQPGEFEKLSSVSRMLPVRLAPDLHERLRRWSTEHGFAMDVVVRGLIERYLDERAA